MAIRRQPQLAMDEQRIDDEDIATALRERQQAKAELSALNHEYQEKDKAAKALLQRLELPAGRVVRVKEFRIEAQFTPAGHREFDTKARTTIVITTPDD